MQVFPSSALKTQQNQKHEAKRSREKTCDKPKGPFSIQGLHTSNLGFQLTQITLGRKVKEQKGAWVRALERFNIVVTKAAAIKSAAQLLGTSVYGVENVKNYESKTEDWSNSL